MTELMPKTPQKGAQLAVRLTAEALAEIDRAIRETQYVKDTDGMRAEYVREAAAIRARAERGYLAGRMGAIVERYETLCKKHLPTLTDDEWKIIIKATQKGIGYVPGWESRLVPMLRAQLEELMLDPDESIFRVVRDVTYAGAVAIIDVCERHWAAVARGEEPPSLPGHAAASPPEPAPAKPAKKR